jgi:hypothetical protein
MFRLNLSAGDLLIIDNGWKAALMVHGTSGIVVLIDNPRSLEVKNRDSQVPDNNLYDIPV